MKKIINIAHRGFTRQFPDNTLEAFKAALELGVDGIEFDVQETADGGFFIFHDDSIGGIPLRKISSRELAAIKLQGQFAVPTLQQALELLGHGPMLIVELKQVISLFKFLEILRAYADVSKVVIVSFDKNLIARVATLAPDIMRAVIASTGMKQPYRIAEITHPTAIGIACHDLDDSLIRKLHEENTMVFVWDCTDDDSLHRALKFDIDGIISDIPDRVKESAGNSGR